MKGQNTVVASDFFFFFGGGIEGAKCISEGAKIKRFAQNGWFLQFFSSDWGKVGGKWVAIFKGGQISPGTATGKILWNKPFRFQKMFWPNLNF